MATDFHSILIANRGEIACRIIRSAKALGLRTIAVYSEADADAPHVVMADMAVLLGPAPAAQSYLDADRILEAARISGAEAIHPGYGFLSENAPFARACAKARLVFIGPDANAIDLMGDKARAKRAMIKAGIPCIPGYQGKDQSDEALIAAAKDIGFPVMVKAASGGGGRGMRLVTDENDFQAAISTARSEAKNAFGDGTLILERALVDARHVEIQVLADRHGHVVHLGERDCSVQRRHQKVIEEAPAPGMTPKLRKAMGDVAVKAAKDIDYVGAGTVEFLLDCDGAFYFLEMNTRLQVEHPVTEMVTGLDLVALQIRIAQGEALPFAQDDIAMNGHAIEARLYAEDPSQDFLPATGPIDLWHPATGEGIRIDAGIKTGGVVLPFYDPMLAKIIAHGATREEARRKLVGALRQTALFGVATNISFLIDALKQADFIKGQATTGFIAQHFAHKDLASKPLSLEDEAIAAVLLYTLARQRADDQAIAPMPALLNWASATPVSVPFCFTENGPGLTVTPGGPDRFLVHGDEQTIDVHVSDITAHQATLSINGVCKKILFNQPDGEGTGSRLHVSIGGHNFHVQNLCATPSSAQHIADTGAVMAPMHGMLVKILVAKGDHVTKGDRVAILEAMKMQHELTAGIDGVITAVHGEAGSQIAANTVVMDIREKE